MRASMSKENREITPESLIDRSIKLDENTDIEKFEQGIKETNLELNLLDEAEILNRKHHAKLNDKIN